MALYQNASVAITSLGGGSYGLQVGPEGYTFTLGQVADMLAGRDKNVLYLLHQIILGLDAAGYTVVSFEALTPAQQKAAIQALTLKW
jgi:hypothetical protein